MSNKGSDNVKLCQLWYAAFHKRALDAMMALFTDDAVVVVGAGGSSSAVDYSGTFVGQKEIRSYYNDRFSTRNQLHSAPRPFCGLAISSQEFGPWVMFWGEINDVLPDGQPGYQGKFLHVWTVDEARQKLAYLEMYLEPSVTPRS